MNDTKIAPALTAGEWERLAVERTLPRDPDDVMRGTLVVFGAYLDPGLSIYDDEQINVPESQRHTVAALALHNQPFGFTRDDARALRDCADALDAEHGWPAEWCIEPNPLRSLADRIEALLPPAP